MRFRKLRIAWSVLCGIAFLLLIALWVRSYWWFDSYYLRVGAIRCGGDSLRGSIVLHFQDTRLMETFSTGYDSKSSEDVHRAKEIRDLWNFYFATWGAGYYVVFPNWCAILLLIASAFAPWRRWRFTIRTLLLATTLIAVVLGVIAAALRWPVG
jgi:hypothetical protein